MKLLYHGSLWDGSTARQRFEAFQRHPGINAVAHNAGSDLEPVRNLIVRLRWKIRWPSDVHRENERLIAAVDAERPDVVFVDNSRVVNKATLLRIRSICDPALVYYSPDDIVAAHNLSWPVRLTFPEWDVFFTTKKFNVPELKARGVRNPVLAGNAFDPALHRPMSREEVGEDYERFDLVFVGTFEKERFQSLKRLAAEGFSIAIYGNPASRHGRDWSAIGHNRIRVGQPGYALDYSRLMHHGKLALCFLRKINRDRITTRSIEIPAMRRPLLAEKTGEHDLHFLDGSEYLGFRDDGELIKHIRYLLINEEERRRIAARGYARCFSSRYATADRACFMADAIRKVSSSFPRWEQHPLSEGAGTGQHAE